MRRRDLLTSTAGFCSLLGLAGCSAQGNDSTQGDGTDPGDGIRIGQRASKPQYQAVMVEVGLSNRGRPTGRATLTVRLEMNASDTYRQSREVRVAPGRQGMESQQFYFEVGREVGFEDYSFEVSLTNATYGVEPTTPTGRSTRQTE